MGALGGIPLEVGDILAKKYRLERMIGEGGTGVVVAARHLQLERDVAIKFLRTALASEEIELRFEREARAIGKIQSEHVVLVYDVGTLEGGSPYMVMEYLEGRDLAKVLKEDGPLAIEDAVDCMLQVCEALAEAHAAGVVHRDLKPANLFLTRGDDGGPHIKVVDFGISKILNQQILAGGPKEMTANFDVLGSPRYMAPEQLRNSKAVDFRADLWSVGAVLFQLVTGKYAFDAESNLQASLKVLSSEPERLRDHVPSVPPGLEAVVQRCLQKDRTQRFQSAKELAEALRPFASDRTRDSLERMREVKETPSLDIALSLSSLTPQLRPGDAPPPSERRPPLPGSGGPRSSPTISVRREARGARPDGAPVGERVRRAFEDPRTMKIAFLIAGIAIVLVVFGVLTAVKAAAQSFGFVQPAREPAASAGLLTPSPELAATAPPVSTAVLLDAGRARP